MGLQDSEAVLEKSKCPFDDIAGASMGFIESSPLTIRVADKRRDQPISARVRGIPQDDSLGKRAEALLELIPQGGVLQYL